MASDSMGRRSQAAVFGRIATQEDRVEPSGTAHCAELTVPCTYRNRYPAKLGFIPVTGKRGPKYTIDECILALDLYIRLRDSGSSMSETSPAVCELSRFISEHSNPRNPKSISNKLANYKHLDTEGRHGLKNKGDVSNFVWKELSGDRSKLEAEVEAARCRMAMSDDDRYVAYSGELGIEDGAIYEAAAKKGPEGFERESNVMARVNQDLFRARVLENYHERCCITGIGGYRLVQACHVKPWDLCTRSQRTDVSNGLCLNPLHHLAFDRGYITIDEEHRVRLCSSIEDIVTEEAFEREFRPYEGRAIARGDVPVGDTFLSYHRRNVFADHG